MTTDPPPVAPPRPAPIRRPRLPQRNPWTLRRRLVVTVVALLLGMAVALGVTSTLALRTSLVAQLDEQLVAASQRSERAPREPGEEFTNPTPPVPREADLPLDQAISDGHDDGAPPFLSVAGQRTGTLGVLVENGAAVSSGYLDEDATVQTLDTEQQAVLAQVPADGLPRTVDVPGLGEFRVLASEIEPGTAIVTGLSLAEVRATERGYLAKEIAITALGLLVAGTLAAVTVRRALRPLDRVAATATRVSELPLDRGEVVISDRLEPEDTDPRTEVGQVGAAFNRLLGHVERALAARHASETQVRQFVADASHELRTPLASIRGYAELVRRSPEELPDSARRALERVEAESVRMSALVEDLLLLARLDAGRPLAREEVDVAALAVDAVMDAHAAGPEHVWRLDVPEEGAVVVGDAARLHQVVANLLTNARVHTPPGTTVTVGVRGGEGGVRVEVRDNGPGVPENLMPVLFQRFSRGDGARNRAAGSTGLGLAIADAVVGAHGGRIEVTSRPGATTFAVWLPSATAA